eukprot:GHVT01085792.1.p1 GENE.GHVT01085792.1~~GHVT01085792.1.p1  ORF type:complete len:109 (+),score=4.33 GHVT01085792.1:67-393(+)
MLYRHPFFLFLIVIRTSSRFVYMSLMRRLGFNPCCFLQFGPRSFHEFFDRSRCSVHTPRAIARSGLLDWLIFSFIYAPIYLSTYPPSQPSSKAPTNPASHFASSPLMS